MKLLAALIILAGLYTYMLLHTTNIVLGQAQNLNATYQYVGNNADRLVAGQ
ncbi:MAG TPA: hypothetical protein VIJ68_00250 [Candidatus Saccharimonadales bacterium]